MFVIYGTQLYGKVEATDSTYVATRFAHIYFLPLFPVASKVVVWEGANGQRQTIGSGLHAPSILAAYLRTWGVIAIGGALIGCVTALYDFDEMGVVGLACFVAAAVAMSAAVVYAYTRLGKLSSDQLGQRRAYQPFVGYPVDVATIGTERKRVRDALHPLVAADARGRVSTTYRDSPDPETKWAEIALDPSVTDLRFLRASLTLTRLDWSLSNGPTRTRAAELHARIWEKLRGVAAASGVTA